ncbi:MAG TPA: hypothetical protein VGL72_06280 [Bryobacteraceae bacterium]|jgi:anti-sigma factor RsiW
MEINTEHIGEERLEAYAMQLVEGDEAATIEEHLLFCTTCQDELEAVEQYVRAMRRAARRIREEHAHSPVTTGVRDRLRNWLQIPGLAGALATAGAALAALILILGLHVGKRPGPPVDVELQAIRGTQAQVAQSGRAIHLHLDGRGLPEGSTLPIEIVDDGGSRVWRGTGTWSGSMILAAVDRSFRPGTYFVRLMKEGADPIREYLLPVQ